VTGKVEEGWGKGAVSCRFEGGGEGGLFSCRGEEGEIKKGRVADQFIY
jgi:hypothetical protein